MRVQPAAVHGRQCDKKTAVFRRGFLFEAPGSVLLLHGECQTTIGAGAFHFRVRDGIGWDHTAMAARESVRCARSRASSAWGRDVTVSCSVRSLDMRRGGEASWGYMVKPHGSLVRVSSMHCCTSTPRLSTRWSTWVLQGARSPGRSHLGARFPLRCFQRLSLPYVATRQCHWHDNRNTSGTSTPVLSY